MAAWISSATGPMTTHFWGPMANWGLAGSGMYDAALKGPEIINERMAATQVLYSGLFVRFAWAVQPRNYILASCHTANVLAQSNQLRRWVSHKMESDPANAPAAIQTVGGALGAAGVLIAGSMLVRKPLQSALVNMQAGVLSKIAAHPAGPFYIHFWAPNFKWALSINNLMDYNRPTDQISLSMTSALTATGLIFMRWSFVITPVNYSLFFVNLALSTSSGYHLARKVKADFIDKK
uniref:Mitochondrial pyruvate carrier n=1 Tax=Alexandrium catenella TaxID=2925 RepID=A0A7S1LR84_ALECA|eukprot:CAMPEP_0171172442 /NCGR_PEP_ID=MMETSP0790-20130122/9721_1 /TAXON_ID=2925 /ORGANISM="Alexandrium catenella, Strain OF101" /LENGTH=235 /DNA_ID=CAMNT_0011637299 /DNA_START=79 /DNA_END=786 /DNA_ORIENTATION=+